MEKNNSIDYSKDILELASSDAIFITGMDFAGKSTLAQYLAQKYNGAPEKYKKVKIYYQSQIAKDF
jgi:thymidylate kinase